MQLYAQTPGRRAWQLTGDVFLVVWTVGWGLFAWGLHRATASLAGPGRSLERAGDDMSGHLREAGDTASGVPVVGGRLSTPFEGAGDASQALAAAGRQQQQAVADVALLLGISAFVVPVVLALLLWLPSRVRYVRRATAARRLLDSAADLDLFALRALAHQPMHLLARVSDDPVAAWRERDQQVVTDLARLEVRAAGLRMPDTGRIS
ncbi:MAG: hypothetical protein ACRDQB_01355 [Thermocrispum sp.]